MSAEQEIRRLYTEYLSYLDSIGFTWTEIKHLHELGFSYENILNVINSKLEGHKHPPRFCQIWKIITNYWGRFVSDRYLNELKDEIKNPLFDDFYEGRISNTFFISIILIRTRKLFDRYEKSGYMTNEVRSKLLELENTFINDLNKLLDY
jgi:hypothetical protein